MEKVIIIIEKSKDYYSGYSENCDGIYGAGESIQVVKDNIQEAIQLIKTELPESQWPEPIKGDYTLEFKLDVQSLLEYYSGILSLAGLEKITGINQKQLWNYLHHKSKPRQQQIERIEKGLHNLAHELLSISL